MEKTLRLLHTSDWHLGRTICGRRRNDEFASFLDWLFKTIEYQKVDVLLIAGDIFDSPTPSIFAQELYYRFLSKVADSPTCESIVIIAGNHDSPSLLNAPGELLKALNIHISGKIDKEKNDSELICLKKNGRARLIVAAVPYPRDRDLRESLAGENPDDKERKLVEAISGHYSQISLAAEQLRDKLEIRVPIVGMGHLFAADGKVMEGDGVRNLYVGSLGLVPADAFPACFDYLALGHLHQPQIVGGDEKKRYSGSPLVHSFSEAGRDKSVVLINFQNYDDSDRETIITSLPVPVFQRLERISGNWQAIESAIDWLLEEQAEAWLELDYTGQEIIGDLREKAFEKTNGSKLEILRIKNKGSAAALIARLDENESLEALNEDIIFRRCLAARDVPENQQAGLITAYEEILKIMREGD